jgi:hypothetical protein
LALVFACRLARTIDTSSFKSSMIFFAAIPHNARALYLPLAPQASNFTSTELHCGLTAAKVVLTAFPLRN